VTDLAKGVDALTEVFIECSKRLISSEDFKESVASLNFSDEAQAVLDAYYVSNAQVVRAFLADLSMRLPHYTDLEWRLDIQLATRCLRQQVVPTFLLNLHTANGENKEEHVLEADFANLKNICQELEVALKQVKTTHNNRVLKYIH